MHRELLEALIEERAYSLGSLSRRVELSEPLVEQLLEELHQRGLILPLGVNGAAYCQGCCFAGSCDVLRTVPGWQLTEAGRRLLASKLM